MGMFPSVLNEDHAFNAWMKRAAPIAVLLLMPVVIALQQFAKSRGEQTLESPPAEMVRDESAGDPGIGPLAVVSKLIVKSIHHELKELDDTGEMSRRPFGDGKGSRRRQGVTIDRTAIQEALDELTPMAVSRTDRFRAAVVYGELLGPGVAAERLGALSQEVDPQGDLAKDINWLRPWYARAAEGSLEPLPEGVQESLRARHGWFGDLAVSHQQPSKDPLRKSAISGGERLRRAVTLNALWTWGGLILGSLVGIMLLREMRGHSLAVMETSIPRHLYMETFALFMVGFVFLDGVGLILMGETSAWAFAVREVMTWVAVLAVFWPLARGATWEELRIDVGLTNGRGVGHEIGAGFLAYFAGIPFVWLAIFLMNLAGGGSGGEADAGAADKFPMFRQPLGGSWVPVVFDAIGACIWAPVFEEIFFRGCIHRYLPFRLPIWLRILISAAMFGVYHPYDTSGIVQVGLSGLVFGYMREWRGSILAPMIAHALHNGTLTAFNIAVLMAVR